MDTKSIMHIKINLSTILGWLTILQGIYTMLITSGIVLGESIFTAEHEDTIFIMHLMTWFIIRSIENLKKNDYLKENKKMLDLDWDRITGNMMIFSVTVSAITIPIILLYIAVKYFSC